jgi:Sulfite exporter TauE/SafE
MTVLKSTHSTRTLCLLFWTGLTILTVVLAKLSNSFRDDALQIYLRDTMRLLEDAQESIVQHKNLFPIDNTDIFGSLLVAFGLMISASGGIGGGGILVPLLIIIFGFNPKYAIPLSNITILGSSITNVILNLPKRHPDADRPLIDWDLILLMEPITMAGAVRIA